MAWHDEWLPTIVTVGVTLLAAIVTAWWQFGGLLAAKRKRLKQEIEILNEMPEQLWVRDLYHDRVISTARSYLDYSRRPLWRRLLSFQIPLWLGIATQMPEITRSIDRNTIEKTASGIWPYLVGVMIAVGIVGTLKTKLANENAFVEDVMRRMEDLPESVSLDEYNKMTLYRANMMARHWGFRQDLAVFLRIPVVRRRYKEWVRKHYLAARIIREGPEAKEAIGHMAARRHAAEERMRRILRERERGNEISPAAPTPSDSKRG